MFFNINQILTKITNTPEWQEYQQYQTIVACWQQIINDKISKNTRPRYFSRQIFGVATSSSVWAQELSLQRYSILKKINTRLDFTVKDIRFSSASWNDLAQSTNNIIPPQKLSPKPQINKDLNLQQALENYLKISKQRSQNLPLCPQCNCPTPLTEIKRWGSCRYCMANNLSTENTL